jgi:hypothetical protein
MQGPLCDTRPSLKHSKYWVIHLEPGIDAYSLGNSGNVEQALSPGSAMEALSLCRETTCGLVLSLPKGLAGLATQVKGTTDSCHKWCEVRTTLRADLFALKGRLTGRAEIHCFVHFTCLNRMLMAYW